MVIYLNLTGSSSSTPTIKAKQSPIAPLKPPYIKTTIYFFVMPYPLALRIGETVMTIIALEIIIKTQNKSILSQSHPVIVL